VQAFCGLVEGIA